MEDIRREYQKLLQDFLSEIITPEEFEKQYLQKVKNEHRHLDVTTNAIIQKLFGDVDAFVEDPNLYQRLKHESPGGDYLTLEELKGCVRQALSAIQSLSP